MYSTENPSSPAAMPKVTPPLEGKLNALSRQAENDSRLSIWLKKLPENSLPIDQTIAEDVIELLRDENCDSPTLAACIQKDPLLCLKLFHCTEEYVNHNGGDIQHLVHLIGLIGFDKIEQVVTKSRKLSTTPHGFKEVLSASLFTAHLASSLLNKKHNASSDRFFLPTLFFNAPLWLMWVAAPKTMAHGKVLARCQPQSYIALSVKKLGFKLTDLLEKANEVMLLPKMTSDALAINPTKKVRFWAKAHLLSDERMAQWFKDDKASRHFFYSVEAGIYLLNQYVIAIYFDWNSKYIQRCTTLLCRHLGISNDELSTTVISLALKVTLPSQLQGLLAPINRVRGLHRDPVGEYNQTAQTGVIDAWREKIRQSDNPDTALAITMNALTRGVGVEHCVIMKVDERHIYTQTHHGFGESAAIKRFHFDWHTEKNLFQKIIAKPCSISFYSQNLPKASAKIPKQFTQYCEVKPCGLLSVFHQKKPRVLIYCDHSQWDKDKHKHFKAIGKALAHTLNRF
ncbi:MAG: hypothetical protein ACI8VC_000511 [Candidatus Endobugula sp.]|jgi:hypothetical protein